VVVVGGTVVVEGNAVVSGGVVARLELLERERLRW